jgi:GNAT superfamily N-acetyltransferase
MREPDLTAAMRLKAEAGWNQIEPDWRLFLEQRPEGCFVAECGDAVVGTVTTIAYGPRLAWISLLLVDSRYRRQGIGTRLMQAALDSLYGWATIALDATPAGRPVYERLGFRAEFALVRLIRPVKLVQRPDRCGRGVRGKTCQVLSGHLAQITDLDRAAIGGDRAPLLHSLHARAPEAAWLTYRQERPAGFCLGRHGSHLSQLGPVVAETDRQAIDVCRAALSAWQDRAVVIDVPASQDAFLAWLRDSGFEIQRPFTRMSYGSPLPRSTGETQTFAICGPEFG